MLSCTGKWGCTVSLTKQKVKFLHPSTCLWLISLGCLQEEPRWHTAASENFHKCSNATEQLQLCKGWHLDMDNSDLALAQEQHCFRLGSSDLDSSMWHSGKSPRWPHCSCTKLTEPAHREIKVVRCEAIWFTPEAGQRNNIYSSSWPVMEPRAGINLKNWITHFRDHFWDF